MGDAQIKLSKKNHYKLVKWKYELGCKNMDELVTRIIKLIQQFKLSHELKDIK